ncbi:MAG: 16S rRNA (cytosine(967)-C(5))-methyltransferase RsmB, partial [Clostridia bacterium]|nr:16S rRNA (cytosine(967)-C(5))-methyltransferase RsmB [Clostridia bacterium]
MQKSGAYSTLAVDSAAGAFGADSTARAFFTKLVYGVTERQITLDYVFSRYLTKPLKKLKPEVLTALRMGTYQILYLERVPDSAAVNESVKLVKDNGCAFAAGLVNAVLRNVVRDGARLPQTDDADALSVRYSAPVELVNLLSHHYGRENAERFLQSALEPKQQTVRVNTLKTTSSALIERLRNEGVDCVPARLPDALHVSGSLTALPAYAEGLFHTEDVASQLCAQTLALKPGDTFIDLCAAPGGKTFTAAELMHDEGTVIACELHPQRAELIRQGAERLGLSCI